MRTVKGVDAASVAYVELDAQGEILFGLKAGSTLESLLVLARSAQVVADQIEAGAIAEFLDTSSPEVIGSPAY